MYTLQTYMGEGPKYTFPRQKDNHSDAEDEYISKKTKGPEIENDKFLISSPGPNSYNPDKTFLSTWTTFPTWNWHNPLKIKSKSNLSNKDKITPGPGEYNYQKEIGLGPKYSFAQKLKKEKKMRLLDLEAIILILLSSMVLSIQ